MRLFESQGFGPPPWEREELYPGMYPSETDTEEEEEMERWQAEEDAKEARRSQRVDAQEAIVLARAAAATAPLPLGDGGANGGSGFLACVGQSRIVEFCWPETCSAILATCRRAAADVADVWKTLATPLRVEVLASGYVARAARASRAARLAPKKKKKRGPPLTSLGMRMSEATMILDFGKLRAGVRTLPLRRSCLRELLIRLLPMRPPPRRPGDRQDHYCWPSEDEEGGGQNFIGGSYALHDYLSRRDATPPNWAPGDVDFWVPCASHALSIHKPKRVAEELTQGARERLGVTLHTTNHGSGNYGARYNFDMRLASPEVACVITDVVDLEYVVDLPYWCTRYGCSHERLDAMARRGVLVDKCSIIGTTPAARRASIIGPAPPSSLARRPRLEPRDILGRFDIDICQVGLRLFVPDNHLIDPESFRADSLCSGQRTYLFGRDDVEDNVRVRSAHCLFLDNPRLRDRIAKYEARGFTFAPWEAQHDAAVARMTALEAIIALPENIRRWKQDQKHRRRLKVQEAADRAARAEGLCLDYLHSGRCGKHRLMGTCEFRHDEEAARRICAENGLRWSRYGVEY